MDGNNAAACRKVALSDQVEKSIEHFARVDGLQRDMVSLLKRLHERQQFRLYLRVSPKVIVGDEVPVTEFLAAVVIHKLFYILLQKIAYFQGRKSQHLLFPGQPGYDACQRSACARGAAYIVVFDENILDDFGSAFHG